MLRSPWELAEGIALGCGAGRPRSRGTRAKHALAGSVLRTLPRLGGPVAGQPAFSAQGPLGHLASQTQSRLRALAPVGMLALG